jgi:hypothetical protein
MNFNQTLTLPAHIMFQEFDNEAILLDIRTQNHFGLDNIGSLLCSQLSKKIDLETIFNSILQNYDVSKEQLDNDLTALIEELHKHELIEIN